MMVVKGKKQDKVQNLLSENSSLIWKERKRNKDLLIGRNSKRYFFKHIDNYMWVTENKVTS